MEIKLRGEMFPALKNGTKIRTSRYGKRYVTVGDMVVFVMTENEKIKCPVIITNVFYCTFYELTQEEAIKEGYSSLEELKSALRKIYNPFDDDIYTIIEFKLIEGMSKRDKIKQIIVNSCGGWTSSQEILEKVVDNICKRLKDVADDYNELLSAYIRL